VVETGYENLLLVRLLIEIRIPSARRSSVADGLSIQEILENWLKLKPTIMSEWNEDRDSLVDLFGSIRDDWIENDLSGWIGANRFYPGTADALKFSSSEVYIVTTKQVPHLHILRLGTNFFLYFGFLHHCCNLYAFSKYISWFGNNRACCATDDAYYHLLCISVFHWFFVKEMIKALVHLICNSYILFIVHCCPLVNCWSSFSGPIC
jgi:hypothetical protein